MPNGKIHLTSCLEDATERVFTNQINLSALFICMGMRKVDTLTEDDKPRLSSVHVAKTHTDHNMSFDGFRSNSIDMTIHLS